MTLQFVHPVYREATPAIHAETMGECWLYYKNNPVDWAYADEWITRFVTGFPTREAAIKHWQAWMECEQEVTLYDPSAQPLPEVPE